MTPRDASTVMLVRDGAAGLEVFLQQRASAMSFAAGMTVFPGGSVEPLDGESCVSWAGPDPAWWGRQLGTSEGLAKALVCAAVRETFEECGVLLAGHRADSVVADATEYRSARSRLEQRHLTLAQFLAGGKLTLRADLLRPWANWITPEAEQRRYDTRFFLAILPPGQLADGATAEAADTYWSTPAAVLRRWQAGEVLLLPPTWAQLDTLTGFSSAAAAFGAAPAIAPVMPVLTPGAAGMRIDFPGAQRYLAGGRHPWHR